MCLRSIKMRVRIIIRIPRCSRILFVHCPKAAGITENGIYSVNCVRIAWRNITVFGSPQAFDERILYEQNKIDIKNTRKKTTQKIKTVKYKVLFDHIFSDRNYSKVYNVVDTLLVLHF